MIALEVYSTIKEELEDFNSDVEEIDELVYGKEDGKLEIVTAYFTSIDLVVPRYFRGNFSHSEVSANGYVFNSPLSAEEIVIKFMNGGNGLTDLFNNKKE